MATMIARSAAINSLRYIKPVQLSAAPVILQHAHHRENGYNFASAEYYNVCHTFNSRPVLHPFIRYASQRNVPEVEEDGSQEQNKLSLFQRFKQMYSNYWYVLVPVHLVTSAGWFGSFYYMAKSGIDVVAIMESWNISEKITSPLKDSSLGYVAISYAMYKIATPVRYTVTLGGTTISINYLRKWGYIKPVPTREQLKEIYMEKKENIMDSMKDKRDELRFKKEQFKDRADTIIDNMEKKIITKINDTKKKTTNTIEKP